MVTRLSAEERFAACNALLNRAEGKGPAITKTVYEAALSIRSGEHLDAERTHRLGLLRQLFDGQPDVLEFLGGSIHHAAIASTARTLRELDIALRAQILAVSDLILEQAAKQVDVEIRNNVERAKLLPVEAQAFDMLDTRAFLKVLRAPARARLTNDEESQVRAIVDTSTSRIDALLESGSDDIAGQLDGLVDTDAMRATHAVDRARAVALFATALTSMVLGRLGRATETENRVMTQQALTPVGVARDILEVAGGAASTPAGGLARENGIALALDGTATRGSNFAQGHTVSRQIEESQGLVATRVFRHSGASNARSEHTSADGSTDVELAGTVFPGQHPDCGCYWTIEWRRS